MWTLLKFGSEQALQPDLTFMISIYQQWREILASNFLNQIQFIIISFHYSSSYFVDPADWLDNKSGRPSNTTE